MVSYALTRKTKSGYSCDQLEAAIANMSFQVLLFNSGFSEIVLTGVSSQAMLQMTASMFTTGCRFSGSWGTNVEVITPTAQEMDSTLLPLLRMHWRFKNNCGNTITLSFTAGAGCIVNTYGGVATSVSFSNNSNAVTPMAVRQRSGSWVFSF